MQVKAEDFKSAKERVLKNKVEENLEGLYLKVIYLDNNSHQMSINACSR